MKKPVLITVKVWDSNSYDRKSVYFGFHIKGKTYTIRTLVPAAKLVTRETDRNGKEWIGIMLKNGVNKFLSSCKADLEWARDEWDYIHEAMDEYIE